MILNLWYHNNLSNNNKNNNYKTLLELIQEVDQENHNNIINMIQMQHQVFLLMEIMIMIIMEEEFNYKRSINNLKEVVYLISQ